MAARKRAPGHRKLVRGAYRWLSVINTVSILLTFNPSKIMKHLLWKRILSVGSRSLWR